MASLPPNLQNNRPGLFESIGRSIPSFQQPSDVPSLLMPVSYSHNIPSNEIVNAYPTMDSHSVTQPNTRRHSTESIAPAIQPHVRRNSLGYVPSPGSSLRPCYNRWDKLNSNHKRERDAASPPSPRSLSKSASSNATTIRFTKTNKKKSERTIQGSYVHCTETIQYSVSSDMRGSPTSPIDLTQDDHGLGPEGPPQE